MRQRVVQPPVDDGARLLETGDARGIVEREQRLDLLARCLEPPRPRIEPDAAHGEPARTSDSAASRKPSASTA